jgi:hypothetical protein
MSFYPRRVGTYLQRGSKFCFVVVVLGTLLRMLHYCPISPCFQHFAPWHAPLHCLAALPGSLARQPCPAALPAVLPGSLAWQPCLAALSGSLARQPCTVALPGSLDRHPCPVALPGSLTRQPCRNTTSLSFPRN